jgi:hypothetical protein
MKKIIVSFLVFTFTYGAFAAPQAITPENLAKHTEEIKVYDDSNKDIQTKMARIKSLIVVVSVMQASEIIYGAENYQGYKAYKENLAPRYKDYITPEELDIILGIAVEIAFSIVEDKQENHDLYFIMKDAAKAFAYEDWIKTLGKSAGSEREKILFTDKTAVAKEIERRLEKSIARVKEYRLKYS